MKPEDIRLIPEPPPLPARPLDSHKGDFGRVLVVGGSRGMIGAPALVANAALRTGAGLVTVACPHSIQLAVATLCPCATSLALPEEALVPRDVIIPDIAMQRLRDLAFFTPQGKPTVVAAGPGLGRFEAKDEFGLNSLWAAFAQEAAVPIVLDADAINALHRDSAGHSAGWDVMPHPRTVITPHPGEMARLLGVTASDIQADRRRYAIETARLLTRTNPDTNDRAVVVLKGHETLVTDGQSLYANTTGNPGMATGGSGDVLTGIIAGLIAQGMSRLDAAVLGTFLHGRAGDLAAAEMGQHGLIATDLIQFLPAAIRSHVPAV